MALRGPEIQAVPNASRLVARWCLVVGLAVAGGGVVTLALLPMPTASAQSAQYGRQPGEMFAVAGLISPDTYGLYLVDPQGRSVVLYEYVPSQRRLHLRAARSIAYDLQLESYNTEPDPGDVADMVRKARRIPETTTQPRRPAGGKE